MPKLENFFSTETIRLCSEFKMLTTDDEICELNPIVDIDTDLDRLVALEMKFKESGNITDILNDCDVFNTRKEAIEALFNYKNELDEDADGIVVSVAHNESDWSVGIDLSQMGGFVNNMGFIVLLDKSDLKEEA